MGGIGDGIADTGNTDGTGGRCDGMSGVFSEIGGIVAIAGARAESAESEA